MTKCGSRSPLDTHVSEEGRAGAALGSRAEIPLQPRVGQLCPWGPGEQIPAAAHGEAHSRARVLPGEGQT